MTSKHLKKSGRVTYVSATDKQAISAFKLTSRLEGIIPALESSHAIAWLVKNAGTFKKSQNVLVCLSGRGDKDMGILSDWGRIAP